VGRSFTVALATLKRFSAVEGILTQDRTARCGSVLHYARYGKAIGGFYNPDPAHGLVRHGPGMENI
jgi:hypothetical protein